jgi:hypothetical protein
MLFMFVVVQDFEKSSIMSRVLRTRPQCYDLAVSVFAAHLQAPAPIFVDVPFAILDQVKLTAHYSALVGGGDPAKRTDASGGKAESVTVLSAVTSSESSKEVESHKAFKPLTNDQRSECLTVLMAELKLAHLPTSQFKSAVAKHQWVW